MARPRATQTRQAGRRGGRGGVGITSDFVAQISDLVAQNEELKRENEELRQENEVHLNQQHQIMTALGMAGTSNGRRRGRPPRAMSADLLPGPIRPQRQEPEKPPKRTRRPITDPDMLERRKEALTRARAVRAERLAAARAGQSGPAADQAPGGDAMFPVAEAETPPVEPQPEPAEATG